MMVASPTTSGNEVVFDVTTGVPQAMASRGGKPKPSYKDGYKSASAPEYRDGRLASLTYPVKRTRGGNCSIETPENTCDRPFEPAITRWLSSGNRRCTRSHARRSR